MELFHVELTEQVSDWLRSKKIKFTLDSEGSVHVFEFWIGSEEGGIQLEYLPLESNQMPIIQLYSECDNRGNSLYDNTIEYDGNFDSLILEIEELIDNIRSQIKVITKIESKIDDIKTLCEEIQVDYEKFITVNYEFK